LNRILIVAGVAAGLAIGWLALDPPAPREAGANSSLPPAARTGAPGELLCSDCHSGNTVNDGVGAVRIDAIPAAYTPNQTYVLTAVVLRPGQLRWGFELTALKNSDNTMAGTLTSTSAFTRTQDFAGKTYISHTTLNPPNDGTFSGSPAGSWTFTWTAPAAGAGTVTFYAAGNAANGNGTQFGDFIYSTNASSMEGTSTDVDATTWGKIKMLYR
jgi:hypothetical protein